MTNIVKRNYPEKPSTWAPRPLEPVDSHGVDVVDIQRIVGRLLRRKYMVIVVALTVLVPAAIATYLTTPLYRSSALIQVNPDTVQVLPYRDVADIAATRPNLEDYMGTQEQLLKSPGLIVRVAQRLNSEFKSDKAATETPLLGERLDIKKIEKSQLFQIDYSAPSPEIAAKIVNLFAEEYIKQNFQVRQATREKAEQDLKKELENIEKKVQLSEKELVEYARMNSILSIEQNQVDPAQIKLSSLSAQVAEAEAALAAAKANMASIQRASVTEFPEKFSTTQIGQLDSKLFQLEQELTTLRSSFGENWPAVVEKRNEIALVKDQLRREKSAVLARNMQQAQLDLRGVEGRQQMLSTSLAEQKELVSRFHNASIQYNILKREVDTNRNLYEGILQRLKQNSVLAGFQFGNIEVVEPARPSNKVDSPKVFWNLGLALALGLGLGICVVIALDFWDTTISSLEDAEQLAPLPSLGCLPLMKPFKPAHALPSAGGNGKSGNGNGNKHLSLPSLFPVRESLAPSVVKESVRSICASILLSQSDQEPRVIVVTSAIPAEGKTTLVSQLGRAFADAGSSTLMIEADFRKPDLSKMFSVGHEDGLSLFLAGHVAPSPKVHSTDTPNLYLVAAGPEPPNPIALLNSERLSSFLKAMSLVHKFVLLDAPPLMVVSDARVLGTYADGVVLVIRAGRTTKNMIRRAWTLLENGGSNVLGMVLNGAEPERSDYAYYNYYAQSAKT